MQAWNPTRKAHQVWEKLCHQPFVFQMPMFLAVPCPSTPLQEIQAIMGRHVIIFKPLSLPLEPLKHQTSNNSHGPLCTPPSPCLTVTSNLRAQIPPVKEPEYRPQFSSSSLEPYSSKKVKGPWGRYWDGKLLGPTHIHIYSHCASARAALVFIYFIF